MVQRLKDKDEGGKINYVEFLQKLGVTVSPGDVEGVSTQIHDGSNKAEIKRIGDQIAR